MSAKVSLPHSCASSAVWAQSIEIGYRVESEILCAHSQIIEVEQ
jgi:hypothetical protein